MPVAVTIADPVGHGDLEALLRGAAGLFALTAHVADRLFHGALAGGALATGRAVGALKRGARADWMKAIEIAPDSPAADDARDGLAKLDVKAN